VTEPVVVAASGSRRKVLFAASEVVPFAKTGGLADVLGALPRAVARLGHACSVILPLYRAVRGAGIPLEPTEHHFTIAIGPSRMPGRLWRSRLPQSEIPVYLIEQEEFFERDDPARGRGLYQYQLAGGQLRDYPDNAQRYILFSRAILEALPFLDFVPDIVHCNDWQTGLVPVYLRELYGPREPYGRVRSLLTIHNLSYTGTFGHWDMSYTGLDWSLFNWQQLEFHGHLSFLKAGIVFADALNTVSPQYAREVQTAEYGCGLEGVLRHYHDKLTGIMNGVDYSDWNPETDRHLPVRYGPGNVAEGKAACKAELQRHCRLPERPEVPLLGVVARLVDQKVSLFPGMVHEMLKEDVQLVLLGTGDTMYHFLFADLQKKYPDRVAVFLGFDEALAHRIEAGADFFLMPSRFEPSGLNQLYSLKYGAVPVVRDTGGLHDTVTDYTPETMASGTATGFLFQKYLPGAFLAAVQRAVEVYRRQPHEYRQLQLHGMSQDWSWQRSARQYEALYGRLMGIDG
jgi:starch synthase